MKKIASIIVILLIAMVALAQDYVQDKSLTSKLFEVTYIVTYNEQTLEQAARMEQVFRNKFADACKVDVQIKEVNNIWISDSDLITFTADTLSLGRIIIDDTITISPDIILLDENADTGIN